MKVIQVIWTPFPNVMQEVFASTLIHINQSHQFLAALHLCVFPFVPKLSITSSWTRDARDLPFLLSMSRPRVWTNKFSIAPTAPLRRMAMVTPHKRVMQILKRELPPAAVFFQALKCNASPFWSPLSRVQGLKPISICICWSPPTSNHFPFVSNVSLSRFSRCQCL